MSKQKKNNHSMYYLPLVIFLTVTAGVILFLVVRSVILPRLEHISVYDSMQRTITITGKLQTASGTQLSVTSVTLIRKTDDTEPLIGQVSPSAGTFAVKDVSFGSSYTLKVTVEGGREYSADILFFQDAEQTSFSNMADGIDFALLNTADTLNMILAPNDRGSLNCLDCSSSSTTTF